MSSDGFVPSVWTCDDDLLEDLLTMQPSTFNRENFEKYIRPRYPHIFNTKKQTELDQKQQKEEERCGSAESGETLTWKDAEDEERCGSADSSRTLTEKEAKSEEEKEQDSSARSVDPAKPQRASRVAAVWRRPAQAVSNENKKSKCKIIPAGMTLR